MEISVSLILLTLFPATFSVLCHNCQYNPKGIKVRSPLFREAFFSKGGDRSCLSIQNREQTTKDCTSICIAQYVSETGSIWGDKNMFFRACADDVLLGTHNMDGKTSCNGTIKSYDGKGFPNKDGRVYWETGMGFTCSSDFCNSQSETEIKKITSTTCTPCQNMGSCTKCVTLDGYTAKCDCTDRNNVVSCGTDPTLITTTTTLTPTESSSITTTSTPTTSKTTSTITSTITATTSTEKTTETTHSVPPASVTTTTQIVHSSTTSIETTTASSLTTSTINPVASTTTINSSTGFNKGYVALIVVYVIFFIELVILIVLIVIYRRSRIDINVVENVEMSKLNK